MICLSENTKFADLFEFLVVFCRIFVVSIMVLVTRLRFCCQTIVIKSSRRQYGGLRGWGGDGKECPGDMTGGDGKKNYNARWELGQFLKYGVGTGTNFWPGVIL